MKDRIQSVFDESAEVIRLSREHLYERIAEAADIVVGSYRSGGGLLLFGNGGSAADAQHIACEMVGRFLFDRPPLKAEALSANTSSLTCIANDYDSQAVFARQIEAAGGPKDVAVGITTSGNSSNVVAGLAAARRIGIKTIALTGRGGGRCAKLADVLLDVPSDSTPRIQEAHTIIYHAICELVEAEMFAKA